MSNATTETMDEETDATTIDEATAPDPEGSDLPTEPVTDNSDGLDEKLAGDVAEGIAAELQTIVKEVKTLDRDAEVRMLREHDEHMRELAQEHQELEREWEAAKLQAKGAKDRMDECALRLRNSALARPTFGPLFDSAGVPAAEAPTVALVGVIDESDETPADWRTLPLDGNVPDIVASAADAMLLKTFGDVHELLEFNDAEDVATDLMRSHVTEQQARDLFERTYAMAKGSTPDAIEDLSADPDYWKAAPVGDLELPKSLIAKLVDHDITTLGELSEAVKACGHEGYRGLEGIGAKKAELIEDAWQKWFAAHPAPKAETPAESPAKSVTEAA